MSLNNIDLLTTLDKGIAKNLSLPLIKKLNCLPFKKEGTVLYCYSFNGKNSEHQKAEHLLKIQIQITTISEEEYTKLFLHLFPQENHQDTQGKSKKIDFSNYETYIPQLIQEAKLLGSSDIHIEVYKEQFRIRMRTNGKLYTRYILSEKEYLPLINKLKIEAKLDIAEKRLPQDGRIHFDYKEESFDIRVSSLPTLYGEKIVLRLLIKNESIVQLDSLGMDNEQLRKFNDGIKHHNGIILISGPTGSGKTTTLYATLKQLNKESTNILTIEDPIEYTLPGVNQVQLKEDIGLNFGMALRTFLRQDPDIIMVGEIRDVDTANMAIRAALTGHLVLSTIHTNSAEGTISRLVDMGLPAYLLAGTLRLSVAQRLVALLCPNCKTKHNFDASYYPKGYEAPIEVPTHYISQGCSTCNFTGIQGRKAIYEVLDINSKVSERIKTGAKLERDYDLLSHKAFSLFKEGLVSFEEIYPLLLVD
jgi:general secretion pathway protein E/type IV pilus assembly protein PilB